MFNNNKFHPNTAERIMAGAKMVIPAAKPRCIKNKIAASVRVLRSNLFSKNS